MYPYFKKKEYLPKEDYSLKLSLVMIFGIIFVSFCQAQQYPVTITIAVSPPYPPKVNEYIAQPNKIMATLVNTSAQARQVYVQGSITGEGSIKVFTDPNYKMPQPLTLQPGIPFQMNYYNIQQVFSSDHLVFQGITKNEILYGTGLPEGDYMICLQAFDYSTNQQVSQPSPQGCSNTFTVTSIEPPVVLQPICGEPVNPGHPQNIIFSWTRPPGAPVNTHFNLKIIEVLPTDRNINDAMRSATHPAFFETTISVTTYILGPSDPQLVTGKKYAFAVTAIDPAGKATFRNSGMSEVCSFTYGNIGSTQEGQIILLTPKNGSALSDTAPTFTWQTTKPIRGALFQINIYEVKPGQTKEETVKNRPFFTRGGITDTYFRYPSTGGTLNKHNGYCWTVSAILNTQIIITSNIYFFGFFSCPDLCESGTKNRKVEFAFTPHGKNPGEMTAIFEWVDKIIDAAGEHITVPGEIVGAAFKSAVQAIMTRGFDVWVRVCCDNCEYVTCWVYWNQLDWVHHCSDWKLCISNETLIPDGKGWKPVGTGTPPITSWKECDKAIQKTAATIPCP